MRNASIRLLATLAVVSAAAVGCSGSSASDDQGGNQSAGATGKKEVVLVT